MVFNKTHASQEVTGSSEEVAAISQSHYLAAEVSLDRAGFQPPGAHASEIPFGYWSLLYWDPVVKVGWPVVKRALSQGQIWERNLQVCRPRAEEWLEGFGLWVQRSDQDPTAYSLLQSCRLACEEGPNQDKGTECWSISFPYSLPLQASPLRTVFSGG